MNRSATEPVSLFKASYHCVRSNSKEIYRGFGFHHLSDATQYYVHPNNQSFKGTTSLCQPIGESVILFTSLMQAAAVGNPFGDYWYDENRSLFRLQFLVPQDYHDNDVIDHSVAFYRAQFKDHNVTVAAYDINGRWIEGDITHLDEQYKMLPMFMVLLAAEMETNTDFRSLMDNFAENPEADTFVNIHEDFYQNHKNEQYEIACMDLADFDTEGLHSYVAGTAVIRQNRNEAKKEEDRTRIITFPSDAFSEEQKSLIPHLGSEFVLPGNLASVCSAVASGDMLAVLLHGPAGTGKTISCKLICQTIGLPIVDTINCTENLDEFVLGKYIPQDDRIIFRESYVTKAIREGGAVVFEEINFAKPQHLAFLNSLLDDNGFVRLDNGETVRRHRNFRFFATMNAGYFGTKELNQALYNRFNGIIEVAELSDEAIHRMLVTRVPECEPVVNKMISVYHKLKKKIEKEELDVVISPRNLENWARLAKYDGYIRAAEDTLIPIAKCDRNLEDTIRGILMLYKWD